MKKVYSLLLTVIITTLSLFAQPPRKMSYQAVIRDSENQLVVNTEIGMQISILQGSADGAAVYIETLTPTTNTNGLVIIEIGGGTEQDGNFTTIDWSDGPYFIKTETDPSGGTNYTITGTSQLLSVPYALHSGSSDVLTGEITESQISDLQDYLTKETAPNVPAGTQPGEMQYWDGSEWITLAPGSAGQVLTFINGVPTWAAPGVNDVENPATGKIWMDRNLGASRVARSSSDAAAYGDLYQWGRAFDGHEIRTSGTTTLSDSDTPGHGEFILAPDSPYDWRSPQNDDLWQGVDGINNPCPDGYRLPTEAELDAERQSWTSNDAAGAFASHLKLPVAGYRDYSSGSLENVGSSGRYWSGTVVDTRSRGLRIFGTSAFMSSYRRANGYSVRCIKD